MLGRVRARLLLAILLGAALAGCFQDAAAEDIVVPYPRMGDVAVYEATGSLLEFARWENGHAFVAGPAQVRFTVAPSQPVIDGARGVHEVFLVTTDVAETGVFSKRSERYVSYAHQGTIQGLYPLSQDQSVLSFDERGFPWLFGGSALFGAELSREPRVPLALPDNLGRGRTMEFAWVVDGRDGNLVRLALEGSDSFTGTAWMEPGVAWPARVTLTLADASFAPNVRVDGAYPATIDARRVSLTPGTEPLRPREGGAAFVEDLGVDREPWDHEAPPDGDPAALAYALSAAIADAKLLDRALVDWLAQADDPRVYRGTYADAPGPVEGTRAPSWLIQWVDRTERYYEVEVERVRTPLLEQGVPRVNFSRPAEPPADEAHGWFAAADVPGSFVPLSEGVRVVKEVFGPPDVQIFLRSLREPAGYSYYIDGGFEVDGGRYTVVYAPNTGVIEEATGPVSVRFAVE